jgi:hypothetical protein
MTACIATMFSLVLWLIVIPQHAFMATFLTFFIVLIVMAKLMDRPPAEQDRQDDIERERIKRIEANMRARKPRASKRP